MTDKDATILALAAKIVSAHVSNHVVPSGVLSRLIQDVVQTLRAAMMQGTQPEKPKPAVPVAQSVTRDSIACLECGKRFRTLKRHLEREHEMSEEEYRSRWQLPASYKLSAPEYAQLRSEVARKIGLGRRPRVARRRQGGGRL